MDGQTQVFEAGLFAQWAGGEGQRLPPRWCGVTQDTRKLAPGCLYVALRGERFDGHDFVGQALAAGAAAALVERGWRAPAEAAGWPLVWVDDTRRALAQAASAWRGRCRARIVGITGSSGKTTVKEMCAALCGADGRQVCATEGNLNNEIGLPLSLLRLSPGDDVGLFEAGMNHPGEIARLAAVLKPDLALVTSIGSAHVEHFGSVAAIAEEKADLLRALPPDGAAVLGLETACFDRLAAATRARLVTASLAGADADYQGVPLDPLTGELRVTERATGLSVVLRSGLPGAHNAANLLLAFAAARTAGVPAEGMDRALRRLRLPGMRWEVVERDGVRVVNDAYNANPDSMEAVLTTFMGLACAGRRVVVLGDMLELGAQSEALHRRVGARVARLAPDLLVAVGPACGRYLADEALRGGLAASRVLVCDGAAAAAAAVRAYVNVGDCVLLKASRGMRLERVLDER